MKFNSIRRNLHQQSLHKQKTTKTIKASKNQSFACQHSPDYLKLYDSKESEVTVQYIVHRTFNNQQNKSIVQT